MIEEIVIYAPRTVGEWVFTFAILAIAFMLTAVFVWLGLRKCVELTQWAWRMLTKRPIAESAGGMIVERLFVFQLALLGIFLCFIPAMMSSYLMYRIIYHGPYAAEVGEHAVQLRYEWPKSDETVPYSAIRWTKLSSYTRKGKKYFVVRIQSDDAHFVAWSSNEQAIRNVRDRIEQKRARP